MKKFYYLSLFLVFGLMAASLTSCGGDDDLLDDNDITVGGDDPYDNAHGGYKYFEPCFEWGCKKDVVNAFMAGCKGWRFELEDEHSISFSTPDPLTYVTYRFYNDQMAQVNVQYYTTTGWEELKETLEKNFHCTFSLYGDVSSTSYKMYMADDAIVNGKKCTILFHVLDQMMSVTFGV